MEAQQILEAWRADLSVLASAKTKRDGRVEITLPLSTLTDKFVRVYVAEVPGGLLLSDNYDLTNDIYETTAERCISGPMLQGRELLAKNQFSGIYEDVQQFFLPTSPEMLTSALFDMGQFIQLSVNLAYLSI